MFKGNEAGWDRIVRIVLGALLLYLGWAGVVTGTMGVILMIVGVVFVITGIIGWCPIYALLKSGTKSHKSA
jgi:hypothetical protein